MEGLRRRVVTAAALSAALAASLGIQLCWQFLPRRHA
jgi:hypothetical protein